MSESSLAVRTLSLAGRRARLPVLGVFFALNALNLGVITWLWVHGGGFSFAHGWGDVWMSIGRSTGLWSAYLALVQVVLLARLPWLERAVGFDRLSVWHRWNGFAVIWLVVAHVVFILLGYAAQDRLSLPSEVTSMYSSLPGMFTAWLGTALLILVVVSSVVIARRRLPYEAWYLVHLLSYAGIALAWFHQIPTGNELVLATVAADYWRGLYVATIVLLVVFRVLVPLAGAFRYRMRVAEVVEEGPGVISLRITGRGLDRLGAEPGQFFLWRFLTRGRWWKAHPFSLSAAPDGRSLRVTVKALGAFTAGLRDLPPGTRIVAEGPMGIFTQAMRRREKVLLIGGGIGITPIRALLEEMDGDVVAIYRTVRDGDVIFRDELETLARERDHTLHLVVGDHATEEGSRLLSVEHLRELVPDVAQRDVYICGPPGLTNAIVRVVRRAGVPARHVHAERFAL